MSENTKQHFPAESEPTRCCYRYSDGERCESTRDTHSFCQQHATMIRAGHPSTETYMSEYMETKEERIARDVEEAARKLSTFANNAKIKKAYQHELLDIVDALLVAVRS